MYKLRTHFSDNIYLIDNILLEIQTFNDCFFIHTMDKLRYNPEKCNIKSCTTMFTPTFQ